MDFAIGLLAGVIILLLVGTSVKFRGKLPLEWFVIWYESRLPLDEQARREEHGRIMTEGVCVTTLLCDNKHPWTGVIYGLHGRFTLSEKAQTFGDDGIVSMLGRDRRELAAQIERLEADLQKPILEIHRIETYALLERCRRKMQELDVALPDESYVQVVLDRLQAQVAQ